MPRSIAHLRGRVRTRPRLVVSLLTLVLLAAPAIVAAGQRSSWRPAVPETTVNSPQADGCPIESPNGRELYIASNRPGTLGGNDIWVSHRRNVRSPWSAPANLGAPVNSEFADFARRRSAMAGSCSSPNDRVRRPATQAPERVTSTS